MSNKQTIELKDRLRRAVYLIKCAAITFRDYEKKHRAKGTHEGDVKADINALEAERLEAFLREVAP